jgi:hypothetical protein
LIEDSANRRLVGFVARTGRIALTRFRRMLWWLVAWSPEAPLSTRPADENANDSDASARNGLTLSASHPGKVSRRP